MTSKQDLPCQDSARNTYRPALQPAWLKHDRQVLRRLGLAKDFPRWCRFLRSNGWWLPCVKNYWGSMHIFRTEFEISCLSFRWWHVVLACQVAPDIAGSGSWESQGPTRLKVKLLVLACEKNLGLPGTSSPNSWGTNPWQESFRIRECNILFYLVLWLYQLWFFSECQHLICCCPKSKRFHPWALQENARKMVRCL